MATLEQHRTFEEATRNINAYTFRDELELALEWLTDRGHDAREIIAYLGVDAMCDCIADALEAPQRYSPAPMFPDKDDRKRIAQTMAETLEIHKGSPA